MQYHPSAYIGLRVVTNRDSDHGFEVLDAATGRPVANVSHVQVERGFSQTPPYHPQPQKVTITFVGIPVDLNFLDWDTFAKERQAAHAAAQQDQQVAPQPAPPEPGA